MSRAASTRDLYSLLPGLTGTLPPELIDLTTSLLAQSRSKASSLKPEEEIARSYACANIACERLKTRLDLPDITPRPPCPQRAYKKLFQYLSGAIAVSSSRPQPTARPSVPSTPSKRQRLVNRSNPATPSGLKTLASASHTQRSGRQDGASHTRRADDTPSKIQSTPSKFMSPSKSQARHVKPAKKHASQNVTYITADAPDNAFPSWLMHSIRKIATELSYPSTVPHIFTGVSILARQLASEAGANNQKTPTPRRGRPSASSLAQKAGKLALSALPPLAFVVASYVLAQFEEDAPSAEEYMERRTRAYEIFKENVPELDAEADELNAEEEIMLPEKQHVRQVESYLRQINDDGWLDMEWFKNVRAAAQEAKYDDAMDVDEEGDGAEEDDMLPVRRKKRKVGDDEEYRGRAGGEMIMYATDWLSEERLRAGKEWEVKFLAKLDEIEASNDPARQLVV